jgi:hypothetical protein
MRKGILWGQAKSWWDSFEVFSDWQGDLGHSEGQFPEILWPQIFCQKCMLKSPGPHSEFMRLTLYLLCEEHWDLQEVHVCQVW